MKCDTFQAIAGQLARNEIMDADERDGAQAHATVCGRCAAVVAAQSLLSDGLRALAEDTKQAKAPANLEGKVLAAFRERTSPVSVSASTGRRRYWAATAAAVLLLAVGAAAWRWYVGGAERQIQQAGSQQTPSPVSGPNDKQLTAAPVTKPPSPKYLVAVTPRKGNPQPHLKKQADQPNVAARSPESPVPLMPTENQEVVTHFVSLGYGSALDLQDGAQMVRVELPRSALARFGLPMNMNRADERIKADVLVGADGLARAIRFVQPTEQVTGNLKPGNERNEQ